MINYLTQVSEGADKWLEEYCVLPMKVDTELDSLHICSMSLAQCDLIKREGKSNIKYDFLDIADIIKSVVMGLEALRVRGFFHNDISLGNILKMPKAAPGSSYRLSDFGAMRQLQSDEEGKSKISIDIKKLVNIFKSGQGFSKGNPINATEDQRYAKNKFGEFCDYIENMPQVSASDVLNHEYIVSFSNHKK